MGAILTVDLIYVFIAFLFFLGCWFFARACETL
jgi:hypothetical protein